MTTATKNMTNTTNQCDRHLDQTHDPKLASWVESANDASSDFPIQNLPFGVFSCAGADQAFRVGVAIGEQALDLAACWEAGLFTGTPVEDANIFASPSLNGLLARGFETWRAVRGRVSELLSADTAELRNNSALRQRALVDQSSISHHMPVQIGDYTDFYASIEHATNVGSMFRPDNPLMPNYKHLPVGYHGRASSVVVSGSAIRRPMGQTKADDQANPSFGPSRLLDYELEMGVFTGAGAEQGERIHLAEAPRRLFGMVVVNDWSARDIQKWEYQPLGPFNAKNFATSISPWVVSLDALEPFRVPAPSRGPDDPPLLDYLSGGCDAAYDITLEVSIRSKKMQDAAAEPHVLSRGNFKNMYWTMTQMLAHHTSTGCNIRPGDLLASGTVSGKDASAYGSMLELSWRGTKPIQLPTGEERKFLADGDELTMRAWCERPGAARIGFGACRGVILPAK